MEGGGGEIKMVSMKYICPWSTENDPSTFHSSMDTDDATIKLEIPEHTIDPLEQEQEQEPSSYDETAGTSDHVFHKPSTAAYQSTTGAPEGVFKNKAPAVNSSMIVDYTDSKQVVQEILKLYKPNIHY